MLFMHFKIFLLLMISFLTFISCSSGDESWQNPYDEAGDNWNPPISQWVQVDSTLEQDSIWVTFNVVDSNGWIDTTWVVSPLDTQIFVFDKAHVSQGVFSSDTGFWYRGDSGLVELIVYSVDNHGLKGNSDTLDYTMLKSPLLPIANAGNDTASLKNDDVQIRALQVNSRNTYQWICDQGTETLPNDSGVLDLSLSPIINDSILCILNVWNASGDTAVDSMWAVSQQWAAINLKIDHSGELLYNAPLSWLTQLYDSSHTVFYKKESAEEWSSFVTGTIEKLWLRNLDTNTAYTWYVMSYNEGGLSASSDTVTFETTSLKKMVLIEDGTFTMGASSGDSDEVPLTAVTLFGYWIGEYEVTQMMWDSLMVENKNYTCDSCPAVRINWYESLLFANAQSKYYALDTIYEYTGVKDAGLDEVSLIGLTYDYSKVGFRLPTEAEWEFAAKGEAPTNWAWGDDIATISQYVVFNDTSFASVGSKKAISNGLYDLQGNAWEWVTDWKAEYLGGQETNPVNKTDSTFGERVTRGGSWREVNAEIYSSSNRHSEIPTRSDRTTGFRLVINER
jgi:formylglycine-generating enzyme required for sulfatase activity